MTAMCIDQLPNTMPAKATPAGVTPIDAVEGPLFDSCLHEVSHALFDMLQVAVLGREEDAADQVSSFIILELGKEEARTLIGVSPTRSGPRRLQKPLPQ